jgi:2,4-dienoyl-CoA reductase-like NADH-dependent reductase (Old Yellow Enzyme family)
MSLIGPLGTPARSKAVSSSARCRSASTFLANPDLVERLRADVALNPVDMATFYTPGHKGYTDYPALAT